MAALLGAQRLLPLVVVPIGLGCGGQVRQLHPVSGDEFTLFPGERQPPPITCSGDTDQRFACFSRDIESKTRELDVAGAFALAAPDGKLRSILRTDALNSQRAPISEDTRFPAASVTKMFVAAATVSLHLDGSLDLQQPIVRYLPELGQDGVGRATLHQLLTHTSGLPNLPQCTSADEDLADTARRYAGERLWAPPGAVQNYSNLGYGFVALVIERVTGEPFEHAVHERVLVPAGIPGASFGPAQVSVASHRRDGAALATRCRSMWPSGGLVLSVRELAHWAGELAHPGSSKLGPRLLELLTAPHVPGGEHSGRAYGYGVNRSLQSGVTIFSHAGMLEDFSAFVAWSPQRELGVAAFANRSGRFAAAVSLRAMSTFLSLSADWLPPGPAHPLSAYTGVYVDEVAALGRLRVSLEDDELVIDYLDGPPPLLPAGFRFVFEPGAARPRYVVTAVGVGERRAD